MNTNIKDEIKKYQRKYFKGVELNSRPTYVYVKKVMAFVDGQDDRIYTYSNVIYFDTDTVYFDQNKKWYFGKYFINQYGYKEIQKSEYIMQLKKYGFSIAENSQGFHSNSRFIG